MINICITTYEHIPSVLALNRKYLISHLTDAEKQNGFLRIEYNEKDLEKIIYNKEIVIAIDNEKVIGYYLVGRQSDKMELDYQKREAQSLFDKSGIFFDKIAYGCQVCIEETYRNNGLFKQLLNTLTDILKNKYTHLLCSVSDDNIVSMKTHINNNWKLINEFGTTKFFIYKIHKSITNK